MKFNSTPLAGSYLIELNPYEDERGWFTRFYCKKEFQEIGHQKEWVQMNHSYTNKEGTIRGMHYQIKPYTEIKMVRCIAGAVFDVIVDLRENSSTFLHWFGIELSEVNKNMLYISEGFGHGFQTLTNDCQLIYLHSEFYTPDAEAGLKYDDPTINIQWPLRVTEISDRDVSHSYLDVNFKGI